LRCSNCGKSCGKTEMELSSKDIKRLEETGYRREEFAVIYDGLTPSNGTDDFRTRIENKRKNPRQTLKKIENERARATLNY